MNLSPAPLGLCSGSLEPLSAEVQGSLNNPGKAGVPIIPIGTDGEAHGGKNKFALATTCSSKSLLAIPSIVTATHPYMSMGCQSALRTLGEI
jgi:hypothetical protein